MIRGNPDYQGAARGNRQQLLQALLHLRDRLTDLESKVGGTGINLKDTAPISTPPPFARFSATRDANGLVIKITNPQYDVRRKNTQGGVLYHHIEVSDDQQFRKNVTQLPVTTQTSIEHPSTGPQFIRFRSSADGKTKNSPQYAQVK
jgi:hypothetical protein